MTALSERFEGLAGVAHVSLATLPTRVERLSRVSEMLASEVWCKRDDTSSPDYGGNKVRKLEFLLADARRKGATAIITSGAAGSHHCLATTVFGRRLGFDVHLVLAPQPKTEHVEKNLRIDLALGAEVHPVRAFALVPPKTATLSALLKARGRKPYVIGPGGSSPVGALGYVEAGLELAKQIEQRAVPDPDAIYVATGTAGTLAGAAIGLAVAGVPARIVGVRVTDRIIANRWVLGSLVHRTTALLRRHDARFPDVSAMALSRIELDHKEFGAGYGRPTDASKEAVEIAARDGLVVETTYTAKALAGLVRDARGAARGKRMLYWHTLSSADLSPLLRDAPPIPERLATRLLR